MKLSAVQIAKSKPQAKDYKLFDGEGLFLLIRANGGKLWRLKYRFNGKEKLLSFGSLNDISLKEARELKQSARNLLSKGIDPATYKQSLKTDAAEAEKNTLKLVALEYFEHKRQKLSPRTVGGIFSRWERHILPYLGDTPIKQITLQDLLGVFDKMKALGIAEPVRKALSEVKNVFVHAVITGRIKENENPGVYLSGGIVPERKTKHMAAVTSPEDVKALLERIYSYRSHGAPIVGNALRLLPLVFVRVGDLRAAKWSEIDLERKEWRFCADKGEVETIVPLSRQAVNILEEVKIFTGQYEHVFPGAWDKTKVMSNNAIRKALQTIGYSGDRMTGHGFRAMARTILEEELRYPYQYIEPQLSHKVRDPLGRAYNRTTHIEARQEMMQTWADYLDELRASPNPDLKALREKYRFRG